jgi:hypothetical protein
MIQTIMFAATITPESADRVGLYIVSALVGLVVTGLIACARVLRAEARRGD